MTDLLDEKLGFSVWDFARDRDVGASVFVITPDQEKRFLDAGYLKCVDYIVISPLPVSPKLPFLPVEAFDDGLNRYRRRAKKKIER